MEFFILLPGQDLVRLRGSSGRRIPESALSGLLYSCRDLGSIRGSSSGPAAVVLRLICAGRRVCKSTRSSLRAGCGIGCRVLCAARRVCEVLIRTGRQIFEGILCTDCGVLCPGCRVL